MRIAAIVPARGGSKGIPNKNMTNLLGKPLIDYTIEAAKHSKYIDTILVSSDSEEILRHAETLGAKPIKRPENLASDHAPTGPLITHALLTERSCGNEYTFFILLQPTSPLRSSIDIDQAFEKLWNSDANSLISVYEAGSTPYKALTTNNSGFLSGLIDDKAPFLRRQDCPPIFFANGAIYIYKPEQFIEGSHFELERTIAYIMPQERSFDIDTLSDLEQIERIMKNETSRI